MKNTIFYFLIVIAIAVCTIINNKKQDQQYAKMCSEYPTICGK